MRQRIGIAVSLIGAVVGSTVVWGGTPDDKLLSNDHVYFERDVLPAFSAAGCNSGNCHGSSVATQNGGFRLSLFESAPKRDYIAIADGPSGSLVDTKSPTKSRLLRKAIGKIKHSSVKKLPDDSPVFQTLIRWIARGANPPHELDPVINRLVVDPQLVKARIGDSFRLRVRAFDSTGSVRDVTRTLQLRILGGDVVTRVAGSEFKVESPGIATVVVKYARHTVRTTVQVPIGQPADLGEFEPRTLVDSLLSVNWRKIGISLTKASEDRQFARRAWVHLTGRHPTPQVLQRFVDSIRPDKRARWIERALAHPGYDEHWSEKWQDWLNDEKDAWSKGDRSKFSSWLRNAFRENHSAAELANDLLTAQGTINSSPASGYLLSLKTPDKMAESVSRFFLGVESRCFRCHDHPIDDWRPTHYHQFVATFAQVAIRGGADGNALVTTPAIYRNPDTRQPVTPSVLGRKLAVGPGPDPRPTLSRWLRRRDNHWFARSVVNRYWEWLMTEPIIPDPHDGWLNSFSPNSELLNALARDLIAHQYDLKYLIRQICNSRAYQLALAQVADHNQPIRMLHYRRLPQRIPPRVVIRILEQVTEVSATECGLTSAAIGSPYLWATGRPSFGKCDLSNNGSFLSSSLQMVNSNALSCMLQHRNGRVARLAASDLSDDQITDEIFLATWCRLPKPNETKVVRQLFAKMRQEKKGRKEAIVDTLWALVNSAEFFFLP